LNEPTLMPTDSVGPCSNQLWGSRGQSQCHTRM